eukprot:COSAG06_NODE_496_length_15043_cov_8.883565_8_plen_207_part_00
MIFLGAGTSQSSKASPPAQSATLPLPAGERARTTWMSTSRGLRWGGAKDASFGSHFCLKCSFCQDKLGTKTGKVEKKGTFCRPRPEPLKFQPFDELVLNEHTLRCGKRLCRASFSFFQDTLGTNTGKAENSGVFCLQAGVAGAAAHVGGRFRAAKLACPHRWRRAAGRWLRHHGGVAHEPVSENQTKRNAPYRPFLLAVSFVVRLR